MTRGSAPFAGQQALPGGYVHTDEDQDTEATARRVLLEKLGLRDILCEQVATFSSADRDPRGWSASVTYFAVISLQDFESVDQATNLKWVPLTNPGKLAFDHAEICQHVHRRIQSKAIYSTLPAWFLPKHFTLAELRQTYERLSGQSLNDSAFRRKVRELDMLAEVEGAKSKDTARPAQLYRLKEAKLTDFDRKI
ncbi:NUDIX hydrolase [Thalassococcus lentus]|uniref:NrtR DNA-binding winged helix domain-containing protein n=1 Tax=Thalassococcus lentus TaxID=1210524 RepID=A0ABT4XPB3_9RHOB|nr:NUDIX domain-containing protein [Thalassococcus lentus]MDA7423779.1 hypothetical protein [Thalassococcus lentus]